MKLLSRFDALVIVDVQKDFLHGGALPIPFGDRVIPILNQYIEKFAKFNIYYTRDWHPSNHMSFKENGGQWNTHCVAYSDGSYAPDALKLPPNTIIISKGNEPTKEAYSAFSNKNFDKYLKLQQIDTLYIGGLATDYCVKETVLDAIKSGYQVKLLVDACAGLSGSEDAIFDMIDAGAEPFALIMLE